MRFVRPRQLLLARQILLGTAIAAIAGCSLNVDVHDPTVIVKGGGDNQTAPANTQLTEPFTVLIADQFGQPVPHATVSWTIQSGGGSLSETSKQTDAGGVASVTYTTGPTPGTATIQARVGGVPPVLFTVTIT